MGGILDGVSAKRMLARMLSYIEPNMRFIPLAVAIHETDQGDRSLREMGGQARDFVVGALGHRVENGIAEQ